jgi:hypothetical protein
MAGLAAIRAAVKTTIEAAISGLQVHEMVPAKPVPPCVLVIPDTADFLVAMGKGTDTWNFDLLVLVPTADLVVGQALLDPYVTGAGASSIRSAIFAAKTLGLASTDAHVSGMSDYGGAHEYGGNQHIGATLRLVVHTIGTA